MGIIEKLYRKYIIWKHDLDPTYKWRYGSYAEIGDVMHKIYRTSETCGNPYRDVLRGAEFPEGIFGEIRYADAKHYAKSMHPKMVYMNEELNGCETGYNVTFKFDDLRIEFKSLSGGVLLFVKQRPIPLDIYGRNPWDRKALKYIHELEIESKRLIHHYKEKKAIYEETEEAYDEAVRRSHMYKHQPKERVHNMFEKAWNEEKEARHDK